MSKTTIHTAESAMQKVWRFLRADKNTTRVAMVISPATRVALGERFGFARGEDCFPKLATALRALGVDFIADGGCMTDAALCAAAEELKLRIAANNLPMIVGTAHFVEKAKKNFPKLANKFYAFAPALTYAPKLKESFPEDGKTTEVVVVAPCKGHGEEDELGLVRITTNELAVMLESACVALRLQNNGKANAPYDTYTGAGVLACTSGGKAEALARQLAAKPSEAYFKQLEYCGLRGVKRVREATVELESGAQKFAVACGKEEAFALLEKISAGATDYAFVEINCCLGGSVCCKGQPKADADTERIRVLGLYALDQKNVMKTAAENAFAAGEELAVFGLEITDVEATVEEEPVAETVEEEAVEETLEEVLEEVFEAEEAGEAVFNADHIPTDEELAQMTPEEREKWVYYRRLSRAEKRKLAKLRRLRKAQKEAEKKGE